MAEKKVKQVVRIFEDGTAEILEGESLENFLAQESAALSLLISHSWANPKKSEIKWIPVKKIQITK
ncbi:MAG: hypothetical protein ABIB55_03025 [Candidatus Nealsonbacteria bacterium]